MSERPTTRFWPAIEPLEAKRLPSAAAAVSAAAQPAVAPAAIRLFQGYLVYRITNPDRYNNHISGPITNVLVQQPQPVPGQFYNVLFVSVRNGTLKTFTAQDDLAVRLAGQRQFTPILTGNQTWAPGQTFVFYVLTKQYYPIRNQVTGGFVFRLDGGYSVAIPGPSGIFLRLGYNPATFNQLLDAIVTHGHQGAQGGTGIHFGMPDTSIYQMVNAKTERNDFGGLF